MSKANAGKDYINPQQVRVLQALCDAENASGMTYVQMYDAAGACRTVASPLLACLRERGLIVNTGIDSAVVFGRKPLVFSVSMAGRRALEDHALRVRKEAEQALRVKPPTRSTQGTRYTPPSNVYYRNSGNRHIASAGAPC